MPRPAPAVLLAAPLDRAGRMVEQVVEGAGVWVVLFGDRPVNVRTVDTLANTGVRKYARTAFVSPGHAFNLAERLNRRHKTDLFRVARATAWKVVEEPD